LDKEEEKVEFLVKLERYINGEDESLFVQAFKQARNDYEVLKAYEEDEDVQDGPPEKTKGFPALHIVEKMMHQTHMLDDEKSVPTMNKDIDQYSQRYTCQDLVLVITFLAVGLIKKKSLNLPPCPKPSKASEGELKDKRDESNRLKIEKVNKLRSEANDKLVKVRYLRDMWDQIENRVLDDYSVFYSKMNKKTKEDNGEMMSVFTQSRVDSFKKWECIGGKKGGNSNGIKRGIKSVGEIETKEQKRLKCEAISKGLVDLTEDDDDDDDDFF
jgi:hypothetical protein